MNAKMPCSIISCYIGVALGFWLWTGCASQKKPHSPDASAEVETQKAGPKKSKAVVSADQVPEAVQQALQARFPSVKPAEWKAKAGNIYEAEFVLKGTEITVMFDAAGKWLETETGIDPAEVPRMVSDAAAKQFKGYKMIETQKVERPDTQHLIYELHFENAKEVVKAQFSDEGGMLKQSPKARP